MHYETGQSLLLNSNSSNPPSVKARHRIAKSPTCRRRRINFPCGCTLYTTIECFINGFKDKHSTNDRKIVSRRVPIRLVKSQTAVVQDPGTPCPPVLTTMGYHNHKSHVQPQPEAGIGYTQMLPDMEDMDAIDDLIRELFK